MRGPMLPEKKNFIKVQWLFSILDLSKILTGTLTIIIRRSDQCIISNKTCMHKVPFSNFYL
jgi:hypothetical protein